MSLSYIDMAICSNCGNTESDDLRLKTCTGCVGIKYCSRECQIAHRPQHKQDCRMVSTIAHAMYDAELFKQPPSNEDCPICLRLLPSKPTGSNYQACCGNFLCVGCMHAPVYDHQGNLITEKKCPFCRAEERVTNKEVINRITKRIKINNDANAMHLLGYYYYKGGRGLRRDVTKTYELWHRAGELGCALSNFCIAQMESDTRKKYQCYKLAAMGGNVDARHNLGMNELRADPPDYHRALKHFMIAIAAGYYQSLGMIRDLYTSGHATRDDYAKALKSYQAYLNEIKSDQRDAAAAYNPDSYTYYES